MHLDDIDSLRSDLRDLEEEVRRECDTLKEDMMTTDQAVSVDKRIQQLAGLKPQYTILDLILKALGNNHTVHTTVSIS